MESLDISVLSALRDWRSAGRSALLATVVRTWGSSPRPVGSLMALAEGGAMVGSVSGGCIEDDLIARYAHRNGTGLPAQIDAAPKAVPRFVQYGVTADEAHRFGLPCGGTLELLLEFNPEVEPLRELVQRLESGDLVSRSVNLADGTVTVAQADEIAGLVMDATRLSLTFGPRFRMLLIGAGQMSEYLATMALACGFSVTVCDPREEYRGAWSVAGARVLADMPDDVVTAFKPDRCSCVVARTHDPELDDMALLEALSTEAFYVGAIGSRRNADARRQRMIEHLGQTHQTMMSLRSPAGVFIGSKTPPEIAVSIMAEVLAAKNGVSLPRELDVAYVKNLQSRAQRVPGMAT